MFTIKSIQAIELGNALLDAAESCRDTKENHFIDKIDSRMIVTSAGEQDTTLITVMDD